MRVATLASLLAAALPLAAQTAFRDPLVQPFAVDSVWNMPIGSGAQYVAINMSGTPGNDVWAPMPQIDDDYIVFTPNAPLTAINYSDAAWTGRDRCPATGGLLVQVPIPTSLVVPNTLGNNGAAFLMPDGRTIIQTQPFTRCVAGGPATSVIQFASVDIYGDGRLGGHGGSSLSTVGGTIRIGEFRPGAPIQHAIKIDVDTPVILARCSTAADCFRWPAFTADAGAPGSYGTQNPNPVPGMKMGALLAIPASTNLNALGLESVPGQMLAWTLQNYGAYIVDSSGGTGFVISAENGPNGSVRAQFAADFGTPLEQRVNSNTPWSRDMQRLVQALYLVTNNGPTSIGGGGTPLQPLALALQPPGGADTIPPSVPGGLAGTPAPLQIALSWTASTDNVGVTGYKVFRNGAQIATTSSLSHVDPGLLPSTLYSYAVAAFDAAGNTSAQSAALSVGTLAASDTQAPTVPAGLVGTALSSSQINLSWSPSTDNVGVTGYYVYLNDVALTTTTATSFQHTGLAAGTTYNYRVSSFDAASNNSAWSATPVSVTTPPAAPAPDTQAPSTSTGLTAAAVSSAQINLSWVASTDNVGVTGYRVYRAGALLATLGAVTGYQNTGLAASTTYSYTVQAVDAAGNASLQSAPASATTQAVPDTSAPSVPTGLTAKAISSSQLSLSWSPSTDNIGVVGYYVYLNDVALVTLTTTSFQQAGLTAGTTYSYRVSSYDAAGNNSAWTIPVSVTTPTASDTQLPSVPKRLKGKAASPTQINLSWLPSSDNVRVTGYYVYVNDVALTTTTARSFQHTGLTPGTTYNYRVSSYDAAGNNSAWTATAVSVRTPSGRIARSDFDGDGKSDILWRNAATGANALWLMNGAAIASGPTLSTVADLTWGIAGVGDFDGDGKADILWRNSASGGNLIWLMSGSAILSEAAVNWVTDFNWSVAGIGDFDGDGKADILWRNGATGDVTIWLMSGGTISGGAVAFATVSDVNWGIAGVGDFDGDGKADILWRNSTTGENQVWLMNGATILSAVATSAMPDLTWTVAGIGDFDGDGKADILWRNPTTGENAIWLMNGATMTSSASIAAMADLNWTVAGTGDFDGDGKTDILWRNAATGQDTIWFMNGSTTTSGPTGTMADSSWSIAYP